MEIVEKLMDSTLMNYGGKKEVRNPIMKDFYKENDIIMIILEKTVDLIKNLDKKANGNKKIDLNATCLAQLSYKDTI